jgi:NADH:ubiquinone oxidoreductase subunit K
MPDLFQWILLLGAFLFCVGLGLLISKRNLIFMLIGLELMLNGANLNWVAFGRLYPDTWRGEIVGLFVVVLAVCETAVGIALIIRVYRYFQVSEPEEITELKEV